MNLFEKSSMMIPRIQKILVQDVKQESAKENHTKESSSSSPMKEFGRIQQVHPGVVVVVVVVVELRLLVLLLLLIRLDLIWFAIDRILCGE